MVVGISNHRYCVKAIYGNIGFTIVSLQDLLYGKEWLYTEEMFLDNKNAAESFDSQYRGGMEFIFPSDETEVYQGTFQKDHGLLWRIPYHVRLEQDKLTAEGYAKENKVRVFYNLELQEESILLQIRICNEGEKEIPFLARLHPAFLITDSSEFKLYAESVFYEVDGVYCSFLPDSKVRMRIDVERPETWEKHDLFVHLKQQRGEFVIHNGERGLRVKYNNFDLPYLTLCSFLKAGKRIGIFEPANIAGVNLKRAAKRDIIPVLHAKECVEYSFRMISF